MNEEKCCNGTKTCSKADTLKYYANLSTGTVEKMKTMRAKFVRLAQDIEALGGTRELSTCFTHIEEAQMYCMKALCMMDPQAVQEECCDEPEWAGDLSDSAAA